MGDWVALNIVNGVALFIQYMEPLHTFVQILAGLAVLAMNVSKAYQILEERRANRRPRKKE